LKKLSTYNKAELGDAMYRFGVCCNTVILRGALEFVRADTRKQWHLTIAIKSSNQVFKFQYRLTVTQTVAPQSY
jgi:hypothetical protein